MPNRVFREYEFFRNGPIGLRKDLEASGKRHLHGRGSAIFQVGDAPKSVYFIGNGALNVYVSGYTGRDVTLYKVGPGELCPINVGAVLGADTALANAKGTGEFLSAAVSAADFRRILGEYRDFRRFVIACVAPKFESILKQISEITTRSVDARIERFFLEHLDELDEQGFLHATNERIGMEIGAAREVVNRKLRCMQKAGLVELERGRIRLLDPDKILGAKSAPSAK